MPDLFEQNVLFVKEHVGYFRAANAYDILDPSTGAVIGSVREQVPNPVLKLLKFTDYKRYLPFTVDVLDAGEQKLLTLKRPFTLFHSRVTVSDALGQVLGSFQQRFSLGGKFDVYDAFGQEIAQLRGDWKGWNFQLADRLGQTLATITKKWAGLGKELLTSADNYVVEVAPSLSDPTQRKVVVAAAVCIDMVLKESQR